MALHHIHTDTVAITDLGGIAIKMVNKTGGNSVKGTVVEVSNAADNAFTANDADGNHPIGVVYEDGIADASECWVVIYGVAQVLLKDTTLSTRGNWVFATDVAGRVDATLAEPTAGGVTQLDQHMREIGHCVETKSADTDVLAKVKLHFN